MYKYWIKLYNNDFNLFFNAFDNMNYIPDAVIFDINIAEYYGTVYDKASRLAEEYGFDIHIDPNTHKIRYPYYRNKKTYKKINYFQGNTPSIKALYDNAETLIKQIIEYNKNLNSNSIIGPYVYLDQDHFPDTSLIKLQQEYYYQLSKHAPKEVEAYYSFCISANALCTPEAMEWIESMLKNFKPKNVYLILSDFCIGIDEETEKNVVKLIRMLRAKNINTIYSHGPLWVYLLLEKGISGFASGINYLSGFKKDYLSRSTDIGGIAHNIHIAKNFCKITPQSYIDAYRIGILDLCNCPVCNNDIPTDTNSIRQHSIYARVEELKELNDSSNVKTTLSNWIDESNSFISMAGYNDIPIIQDVPTSRLERFLNL